MNSNWSYSPETVKLSCDLCDLDLWPLTLTFCMDLTLVIGNNSWKFHDDANIVKKVWQTDRRTENTICRAAWSQLKRCDKQTDGRTDRQTENTICRAAWSQLKKFSVVIEVQCICNYINSSEYLIIITGSLELVYSTLKVFSRFFEGPKSYFINQTFHNCLKFHFVAKYFLPYWYGHILKS